MNRLLHVASLLAIVLSFCGLPGCNETPAAPGPPRIIAGESRDLGSEVVSPSGTFIQLDLPGDSLDGIELEVPEGTYDEGRTFRFSASPITSHEFGEDFNPLTPLIKVENGGGYSAEPMTLRIPCTIPDGHFAMAFVYDRATGRIEGVPTIDMDESSITILTSNFDFSSVTSMAKSSSPFGGTIDVGGSEIVVSSIPEAKLDEPYNSEFRPGVDDWQFTNFGSYVYAGHCAGQSATMMWYFSNRKQKRGDEPLHGRFDNDGARTTPKIWQDDVAGYRFCGFAQKTLPWSTIVQTLQLGLEWALPNKVTYNLFAYAIRITKQPQFVYIIPENGDLKSSHAMVVYKVEGEKVYIADPNYPGKTDRLTEFSFGNFLPYYSGPNAQNVGLKYTTFRYLAQSSIINTTDFNSKWSSVIGGTIGDDLYPRFTINVRDQGGTMSALTDGFETRTGNLELEVRSSTVPLKIAGVFGADENPLPFSSNVLKVKFGEQLLGFWITDMNGNWVGFEWIRVVSKEDGTVQQGPPVETGIFCGSSHSIDGTERSTLRTSFERYADGTFRVILEFAGGSMRMVIKGITGLGSYPLYGPPSISDRGSQIFMANGSSWTGGGSMTIDRYDSEGVGGTFTFESKNSQGEVVKRATGQFFCTR